MSCLLAPALSVPSTTSLNAAAFQHMPWMWPVPFSQWLYYRSWHLVCAEQKQVTRSVFQSGKWAFPNTSLAQGTGKDPTSCGRGRIIEATNCFVYQKLQSSLASLVFPELRESVYSSYGKSNQYVLFFGYQAVSCWNGLFHHQTRSPQNQL